MSSKPLAGKVALITGGSKGIGRATALRLAKDGAHVVVTYSSDTAAAEELVKEIDSNQVLAIKADAGNVAEFDGMIQEIVNKLGKIDILIPNAAVLPMKDLENTSEEDFDKTITLNVKGPYFLAQVCLATALLDGLYPVDCM